MFGITFWIDQVLLVDDVAGYSNAVDRSFFAVGAFYNMCHYPIFGSLFINLFELCEVGTLWTKGSLVNWSKTDMRFLMRVLRQGDSYAAKWAEITVNQINQRLSVDIIACTERKGKYFKFNGSAQLGEGGADMTKEQRKELLEK